MSLANGFSPSETSEFYKEEVEKIFVESYTKKIISIDNFIAAAFENTELREMLEKEFGEKRLKDITKYKVFVPAFKLQEQCSTEDGNNTLLKKFLMMTQGTGDASPPPPVQDESEKTSTLTAEGVKKDMKKTFSRWRPEFFHNFDDSKNSDTKIADVVLRTTAAPTYFPIYQGYVDGGTFANNPSLAAAICAMNHGIALEDISILSISTGFNPHSLGPDDYKGGDWGLYQWASNIIPLLLDSGSENVTLQCQTLFQDRFHRLDPILPQQIDLSDASALSLLIQLAKEVDLTKTQEWIERNWMNEQKDPEKIPSFIIIPGDKKEDEEKDDDNEKKDEDKEEKDEGKEEKDSKSGYCTIM